MSTISNFLPAPPDGFSTTLSASISSSALSIPLNSVSGLGTEGVGQLFKKDSNGLVVPGSVEYFHWTNVSGNTLTLSDTGDRGLTGSASGAQAFSAGDYFEVWVTGQYYYKKLRDGFLIEHNQDGTLKGNNSLMDTDSSLTANSDTKVASQKAVKSYVDTNAAPNSKQVILSNQIFS